MTARPDDECRGCREPVEQCVCWVIEQDGYDPRLLAAFARHTPPLDLSTLSTRTEQGEQGWLVEVVDDLVPPIRVYLDDVSGQVVNVPPWIEWAEQMAALSNQPHRRRRLTTWPERPSSPAGRCR